MKSRKSRAGIAIVMGVGATLALAGCGGSAPTSDQPASGFVPGEISDRYSGTTITVALPSWAVIPTDELDAFTAETGITVNMEDAGGDYNAMHDKFVTTAAAGQSMGDVIELGFDWVGQFAAAGWLTPLEPFVTPELLAGSVGADAFVYDGESLGVPYNVDLRGSIINMSMFEQAGVTAPPETWAEVLEDAKKVKAAGIVEYPIGLPLSINESTSTVWYALQRGSGGEVLTSAGEPAFADGSVGVDSLQFIRDLYEAGLVDPGSVGLTDSDVNNLFSSGTTAMVLGGGPGSLVTFADPASSSVSEDDVQLIHLPGQDDNTGLSLNFNESFAIPAAAAHKEAAAMFIAWRSSKEMQLAMYRELGMLPPSQDAISTLDAAGELLGGEAIISIMDNVGPLIVDGPPTWYGAFSSAAASTIQEAALGNTTPDDGVANLVAQVETLAKK